MRAIGEAGRSGVGRSAIDRTIQRFVRFQVMPSTVIRRFDYDPALEALDVEFVTGRRYRYHAVPGEVAQAFHEAFSKGRYFNANIRDAYRFEELDGAPHRRRA